MQGLARISLPEASKDSALRLAVPVSEPCTTVLGGDVFQKIRRPL